MTISPSWGESTTILIARCIGDNGNSARMGVAFAVSGLPFAVYNPSVEADTLRDTSKELAI
jgi:hypothetical protein